MRKNHKKSIPFIYKRWKGFWIFTFLYIAMMIMILFFLLMNLFSIDSELFSLFYGGDILGLILIVSGILKSEKMASFFRPKPKIRIHNITYHPLEPVTVIIPTSTPPRVSVEPPSIWIILENQNKYIMGRNVQLNDVFIENTSLRRSIKVNFHNVKFNIMPLGVYDRMLYTIPRLNNDHEYKVHVEVLLNDGEKIQLENKIIFEKISNSTNNIPKIKPKANRPYSFDRRHNIKKD